MSKNYEAGKGIIELSEGSIVDYNADAIVCPTNPQFMVGNLGTSGAIKRAAGRRFLDEVERLSKLYDEIRHGDAYVTTGGEIPVKYIIHAVCTGWDFAQIAGEREGFYSDGQMIRESTKNSLRVANGLRLKSLGFSALGTGMGGVQLEYCVDIMLEEFATHLGSPTSLEKIGLVLYGEDSYRLAQAIADKKF